MAAPVGCIADGRRFYVVLIGIEGRLNLLASKTGRSKEYFLREIVERGIEDIEDLYLSMEVLARIRAGRERVYSSAEVRRAFALND